MRVRHIVICGVSSHIIFFHISHERQDFRKNVIQHKMFWFPLQISSETFLILRRNERDMITNVYWSSCEVPVILVRFCWNLNFLDIFSKNTQMSNLIKIRPVWAELFHADEQTDRQTELTKLIVVFRNFANTPKLCRFRQSVVSFLKIHRVIMVTSPLPLFTDNVLALHMFISRVYIYVCYY
jgi:hypothetical protein